MILQKRNLILFAGPNVYYEDGTPVRGTYTVAVRFKVVVSKTIRVIVVGYRRLCSLQL